MWQLTGSGDGPYEIQEDGKRIALITHTDLKTACKMAAAKKMLEACRQSLAFTEAQIEYKEMMGYAVAEDTLEIRNALRAAISVAEGN